MAAELPYPSDVYKTSESVAVEVNRVQAASVWNSYRTAPPPPQDEFIYTGIENIGVIKLDLDGGSQELIVSSPASYFRAITFSSDLKMFVTNDIRVDIYTLEGELLAAGPNYLSNISGYNEGVTVLEDGSVVHGNYNASLQKLTSSYEFEASFSSSDFAQDGIISLPAQNSNVYWLGAAATLYKLTSTLELIWDLPHTPESSFDIYITDGDMTIDAEGNIITCNGSPFGSTSLLRKIKDLGSTATELWAIKSTDNPAVKVTCDLDNYIYAGTASGLVIKYTPDGTEVWSIQYSNSPVASINTDSAGDIYIAYQEGPVFKIDATGDITWDIDLNTGGKNVLALEIFNSTTGYNSSNV